MCLRTFLVKILTAIALIVSLVSCGENTYTKPRPLAVTPPQEKKGIAFDIAGLHIYSPVGSYCLESGGTFPFNVESNPDFPQGNLVLATHRLRYDSSELQQMTAYVTAYLDEDLPLPLPPPTLSWISAGTSCKLQMDLTNIGTTNIQVDSLNLRLLKPPQQNTMQYFLVDVCSLVPPDLACNGGGAHGVEVNYHFQFDNGNGSANAVKIFSSQEVTQPVLKPNDTLRVGIEALSGKSSSPNNLIYYVVPELVLNNQNGQQTIELSQLTSALYFANYSRFSCYTLQGTRFILLPSVLREDVKDCL